MELRFFFEISYDLVMNDLPELVKYWKETVKKRINDLGWNWKWWFSGGELEPGSNFERSESIPAKELWMLILKQSILS